MSRPRRAAEAPAALAPPPDPPVASPSPASAAGWLLRDVVLPFAATRLALLLAGWLALNLMLPPLDYLDAYRSGTWLGPVPGWLSMWARWDGAWYLDIAQNGYSYDPSHPPAPGSNNFSNVAFSPLYPIAIKAVSLVVQRVDLAALTFIGVVVANLALLVGLGYLVALVRAEFDPGTARRTGLCLLAFPTSLFLSAVYPESLFLALLVSSFYYARHRRWWLAGLLGGLCALCRPQGVLVVLPLAYAYFSQRRFAVQAVRWDALALATGPALFAGWLYFLFQVTGNPFAFFDIQRAWYRTLAPPWEAVLNTFTSPINVHAPLDSAINLAFAAGFAVLTALAWRVLRPTWAILATVLFVPLTMTGHLGSLMRIALPIFPVFVVLAVLGRHQAFREVYIYLGMGLGSLFMAMFALGYWVA